MGYFSWQEEDAYREGRRDAEYGRKNSFDYDKHAWDGKSKAYFDGQREYEREEERRRELREEEYRQEEAEQRRIQEKHNYLRQMEEDEYYRQMEQEQNDEEQQLPPQEIDDLPY